jgi:hypothetical protein
MVAKEVCKLSQFYSYLGATCINPCKKVLVLKSKKVNVKVSYKIDSEHGWSRSCHSDFRLLGAGDGAERNNFGSATLVVTVYISFTAYPSGP